MQVLFSILSYYPSFITNESINVGILFHDITNDVRIFETTTNWNRLKNFDDEVDINYLKAVLEGIKIEVENSSIFTHDEPFNLIKYVKYFVNELKFSEVAPADTNSLEDFISETKKMFLRFDYDKKDRPSEKQQLKYIKDFLKSSKIDYTSKNIVGYYNENIQFDYIIGEYAFKMFIFGNKKMSSQVFPIKSWAFTAEKLQLKYKTIFIYDVDREDDPQFISIMEILKESSYKVLKFNEAIDFILGLRRNEQNFVYSAISD